MKQTVIIIKSIKKWVLIFLWPKKKGMLKKIDDLHSRYMIIEKNCNNSKQKWQIKDVIFEKPLICKNTYKVIKRIRIVFTNFERKVKKIVRTNSTNIRFKKNYL